MAGQLNRDEFIKNPTPEKIFKKYKNGGICKNGRPGFSTPLGKFEIKSSLIERHGPEYMESVESSVSQLGLAGIYLLVLNTGTCIMTIFRS